MQHFDYIDLLRGLAIFGVVAAHSMMGMAAIGLTQLPFHIDWLLSAGRHGVSLFFVVSAFTLIRSLNSRRGDPMFFAYFVRRFFRIVPAYYLVLLLVFFAYGKGFESYTPPGEPNLTWPDLAAHLLFVNGLFPYYINDFLGVEWSIAAEFPFYAMLPFIFLWLRNTEAGLPLSIKAALLYGGSLALLWMMYWKAGPLIQLLGIHLYPREIFVPWTYFFILTHMHEFAAGIAVWTLMRRLEHKPGLDKAWAGWSLGLLIAAGIALACLESWRYDSVLLTIWAPVAWGLMAACLIYLLSVLNPPPLFALSYLGKISFSLYLVHMPIVYGLSRSSTAWRVTDSVAINFGLYQVVAWSLSLTTAALLFHFVEKPGMRMGKALLNRFPKPAFAT